MERLWDLLRTFSWILGKKVSGYDIYRKLLNSLYRGEMNEFWPLKVWSFQQCTEMKNLSQMKKIYFLWLDLFGFWIVVSCIFTYLMHTNYCLKSWYIFWFGVFFSIFFFFKYRLYFISLGISVRKTSVYTPSLLVQTFPTLK